MSDGNVTSATGVCQADSETLPPCPHNAREWNPEAPDYRTQCYCRKHGVHVSPKGVACVACIAGNFPNHRQDLRGCVPCRQKMLDAMRVNA